MRMTATESAPKADTGVDEAQRRAAQGDLREFLRLAEASGELVVIEDANPHLEIGALYELSQEHEYPPVLLFDRIKGYPPGRRILANIRTSRLLDEGRGVAAVQAFRAAKRQQQAPTIPPEEVASGPVFENVLMGDAVNVLAFPAPRWHDLDGGPYIGTECLIINQDPDTGWVNVGTYRVQVHDARRLTVFIEPGKHGNLIRQKYWDRGVACPMVVVVGQAPILGRLAGSSSRYGESELDVAGGRLGRPIQIVRGKITGLPIPADAEIVFEGYVPPREVEAREEGPFGEWPGYYGSNARPEPVLQVQAIYHRNDPIMTGQPPAKPTYRGRQGNNVPTSAAIWDALEAAGVPGVKGVWKLQGGGSRFITVVAIEQQHPGHAKMAGLVATGCGPAAYLGRMTIVVDDDVDITNPIEVLWALATRWDPKTQTDIVDGCWTGHIDPLLDPAKRERMDITNSRAILYAVRPYHWRDEFPKVNEVPRAYAEEVRAKWADELAFLRK
jgi:4-hydroxy-3-polyprenylbenzoate decarboxylase